MEAAMGSGQAMQPGPTTPGHQPRGDLPKAAAPPRDEVLGLQLEEQRNMAIDAARYHCGEFVRAMRVVEACEFRGANGLADQPDPERIAAMVQEALEQQTAPTPYPTPAYDRATRG